MFKQIILPLLATIAFIAIVGFVTQSGSQGKKLNLNILSSPKSSYVKNVKIGGTEVFVDIANTSAKRQKGLAGRTLKENQGMLFVFEEMNIFPTFWMKDMTTAIDIIWIDDGKVQKVDKEVQPEPGVADSELKKYFPEAPIDYVLEVSSGFSEKNNITPGDSVEIPEL